VLVDERIGFITPKGYEKGYYLITIKMKTMRFCS